MTRILGDSRLFYGKRVLTSGFTLAKSKAFRERVQISERKAKNRTERSLGPRLGCRWLKVAF